MIVDLAQLPPWALLTVQGLATVFGRDAEAIQSWVRDKQIPPPILLGNAEIWTAGCLLDYLEARLKGAPQHAERAEQEDKVKLRKRRP